MIDIDYVIELGRTVFLCAMLIGVYFQSGVCAAALMGLIIVKIEDIVVATNMSTINVSVIADFLDEKHDDFTVEDSNS